MTGGADTLTVNGGLFSGNKGAGAITADNAGSGPRVNGATFAGNMSAGYGGAIYDFADASGAVVTNCTFYRNTAAGDGAIFEDTQGGGLFSHDRIYDNSAAGGGGLYDSDSSDIENSQISGNHAGAGGGVVIASDNDSLSVTGTDIAATARKTAPASCSEVTPACRPRTIELPETTPALTAGASSTSLVAVRGTAWISPIPGLPTTTPADSPAVSSTRGPSPRWAARSSATPRAASRRHLSGRHRRRRRRHAYQLASAVQQSRQLRAARLHHGLYRLSPHAGP